MISPRDSRLLSDYIDGQLKPRLRARLEERLETEADLRQALDDMARTCRLLRSQETLRAPRNFILTPAMVGGRKPAPPPVYPVFGLVSAMTALLLILVLAGDWLSRGGVLAPRPEAMEISQVMVEEQPVQPMEAMEEEQVADESTSEPLLEMAVEAQPTAAADAMLAAPSAKSAADPSAEESARSMAPSEEAAPADLAETAAEMGAEAYPYPEIYPYPEAEEGETTLFGMPRLLLTGVEALLGAAALAFLVLFLVRRAKAPRV